MPQHALNRVKVALYLLLGYGLSACAGLQHSHSAHQPPLPDTHAMPCCWQILEHVQLQYTGEELEFLAAMNITPERQTLVLLDPLGTKLLHSQRSEQEISIEQDVSDGKIPVRLLWTMINLLRTPASAWPLANTEWQLHSEGSRQVLRYKGSEWARADFIEARSSWTIDFLPYRLTVSVRRLEENEL